MKFHILPLLLLTQLNSLFGQDSLCYNDIDKIVAKIKNIKCSRLDTGYISKTNAERYRECYITDTSGTELLAVMTSVRDTTYYSTHINYYFHNQSLIKIEMIDMNSYKKMGLVYFYYTKGKCQPFNHGKHLETVKIYHQRQATIIQENWKRN